MNSLAFAQKIRSLKTFINQSLDHASNPIDSRDASPISESSISHTCIISVKTLTAQSFFSAISLSMPPGWRVVININGVHEISHLSKILLVLSDLQHMLNDKILIQYYGNSAWGRSEMLHANLHHTLVYKNIPSTDYYHVICEKTIPLCAWKDCNKRIQNKPPALDNVCPRLFSSSSKSEHSRASLGRMAELHANVELSLFRTINYGDLTKISPLLGGERLHSLMVNYGDNKRIFNGYSYDKEFDVVPPGEAMLRTDFVSILGRVFQSEDVNKTVYRFPSIYNAYPFCPVSLESWPIHQHSPFVSFSNDFRYYVRNSKKLELFVGAFGDRFAPEMRFGALAYMSMHDTSSRNHWNCQTYTSTVRASLEHEKPKEINPDELRSLSDDDYAFVQSNFFRSHPHFASVIWGRKCSNVPLYLKFLSLFTGLEGRQLQADYSSVESQFQRSGEDDFFFDSCGVMDATEVVLCAVMDILATPTPLPAVLRSADAKQSLALNILNGNIYLGGLLIASFVRLGGEISLAPVSKVLDSAVDSLVDKNLNFRPVFTRKSSLILAPSVSIGDIYAEVGLSDFSIFEIDLESRMNTMLSESSVSAGCSPPVAMLDECIVIDCEKRLTEHSKNVETVASICHEPLYSKKTKKGSELLLYCGLFKCSALVVVEPANPRRPGVIYGLAFYDLRSVGLERIFLAA